MVVEQPRTGGASLVRVVGDVTDRAATLEDAIRGALASICAQAGWHAARAQLADETGHVPHRIVWHLDDPDQLSLLRPLAEQRRANGGGDLARRVLASGEPATTSEGGATTALAFPVVLRKRTVAALEFFSGASNAPSTELVAEIARVCRDLGEVIERKPAEESLRRAERDYRDLFESAGEALIVTDDDMTAVLDANPYACELCGWPWPELVGRDLRTLWRRKPAALHDGSTVRFETLQLRRDGSEVLIEVTASPVRWRGRPARLLLAREIPERERVLEALRASADRDRLLFDKSPQPMWVHDAETLRFLAVNDAIVNAYGFTREELLAMKVTDLRVSSPQTAWVDESEANTVDPSWAAHAQRHKTRSGEVRDVELASHDISYEGRRARLVAVNDVTTRRAAQQRLLHAAFYDALTGLPNRALFKERLELAHARAQSGRGAAYTVLFLDLDRFKMVNDSLGHDAGDDLLVQIARRLEATRRRTDIVARLGGDEFTVLVEGVTGPAEAVHVAERFHRALAAPFNVLGNEIFASVSIGIALGPGATGGPETLLREADTAMYRAKVTGLRHAVFDLSMQEHALASLRLETELRHASSRGELRLHFQPIVELPGGRMTGVEALVRWQHAQRGLLLPGEFLGMAEQTGSILEIGRWVLTEACEQARRLAPDVILGVNLSGHQLLQPDVVDQVRVALERSGLPPERLLLELTESTLIDSGATGVGRLEQLRKLGARLCIDDFGTGYSSLSYLHELPIDALKIAAPFVRALQGDQRRIAIVKSILLLGRALDIDVVAEGVETKEQAKLLTDLGCLQAQGYLFSRPVEIDALPH